MCIYIYKYIYTHRPNPHQTVADAQVSFGF